MRYILPLSALVLLLAACGGASTPAATATALLSKAGATADGPAFLVGPDSSGNSCNTGAAEADGQVSGDDVSVCVYPSSSDMLSQVNSGNYAADAGLVQVGQATLIIISAPEMQSLSAGYAPPASLVQSVASKTGGQVFS